MITDAIGGVVVQMVAGLVSLFPVHSLSAAGVPFSGMVTFVGTVGGAIAVIDVGALVTAVSVVLTGEGLIYGARASVKVYRLIRGA